MNLLEIKAVLDLLQKDNIDDIRIVDGNKLYDRHTLIHSKDSYCLYAIDIQKERTSNLIKLFNTSYSEDYEIDCFYQAITELHHAVIKINKLDEMLKGKQRIYLLFHPINGYVSVNEFQELIARLRAPDGCPWDKEQTHQSLRTNLLEETYEVLDAIDEQNNEHLREELGDLLLQIVLHSQIAVENEEFSLMQVVHDIHQKLIHRHPHVFGKASVGDEEEALRNWEKIKEKERNQKGIVESNSILSSIPKKMPSLSIAQQYQERAARVGFDWSEIGPVFEKINEELKEVINAKDQQELEKELGDLLFAVVNLVRWNGFDAESALRLTNKKFFKRFEYIEKKISESGQLLTDVTLSEMDALWDEVKLKERSTKA
ncbi:MAG: nucleoside triphosphate pyrophosphohydrolase [Pelolinea sp.]|nr:nucleoside triphosphate pyrophosphohydrolase [Pelolinea sp.]